MVTVVGSLNYDLTIALPHFPLPGEAVIGGDLKTASGGKGANQAFAIAKMGAPAFLIGAVGQDSFGDEMIASLQRVGVDTSGVMRRDDSPSGVAMIWLDASGQNEIGVAMGANATLGASDVEQFRERIRRSRAVVAQLETTTEATEAAMRLARGHDVLSILNTAPFVPITDELLRLCDFVIPNENEATKLSEVEVVDLDSAAQAARAIRSRGAKNALVTLGSNGVWLDCETWRGHVPAFKVKAVDTVGAGDTFIGAFVSRLTEGASVQDAARFGCAASAIAVTRYGSQPSVPTRKEVEEKLKE
jgi:ribokinase